MTPEPIWVDLGLPSGLLWMRMNLGATTPKDVGLYFSWGNTEGHTADAGYIFSQEVYSQTPGSQLSDDIPINQDAARAALGDSWRMPSVAEFQELVDNCTRAWTVIDDVAGLLFTSNINGKTVFFPASGVFENSEIINPSNGYYWSTTYVSATGANRMSISSSSVNLAQEGRRYDGMPVRPVLQLT